MAESNLSETDSRILDQIKLLEPQAVILDMDDTLYWEREFIVPFVENMSEKVSIEIGSTGAKEFRNYYLSNWDAGLRKDLFGKSIRQFSLTSLSDSDFLEEMRIVKVANGLRLRPWASEFLTRERLPIAVLTNGDQVVQKNKYDQLVPKNSMQKTMLVCAKDFSAKPSPLAVKKILNDWNLKPKGVLLIGDSETDRQCAISGGCLFVSSV
jgi:HAD superfamily hydrolase (TIGR01549 family)